MAPPPHGSGCAADLGQDGPPSCGAVPHPLPDAVIQVWDKGITHASRFEFIKIALEKWFSKQGYRVHPRKADSQSQL